MKFSLKKLFGDSENQSENEAQLSDDFVNAIIKDIDHVPYAKSKTNVLYAGANELGGYLYFQTIVVGQFKLKTKKGAELELISDKKTLTLKADMDEFESDHTDVKNRYITKIDFEIDKAQLKTFDATTFKSVNLKTGKKTISLNVIDN
ncbi:MAG: hypothetical protein BM564_09885 [Bacteroidetes bacterium MedPE-SWsnd-G2]|nr:MAG: hypothetical protein BM564_09885 [Bacteroidetes bacterium MedPE-SWsnd-G2]